MWWASNVLIVFNPVERPYAKDHSILRSKRANPILYVEPNSVPMRLRGPPLRSGYSVCD